MASFLMRGRIAAIRLANPPVNGLSLAVRQGLMDGIDRAEKEGAAALVLSGAGGTFSAGADIAEFATGGHLTTPSLNEVITRLQDLDMHTVAAIHGTALGGGFELALSCQWRALVLHPKALCGLPEVHLGILPGAGGTQRLPRLVGVEEALRVMTSGAPVKAAQALSSGMVDRLLPADDFGSVEEAAAEGGFALAEELLPQPLDRKARVLAYRPVPPLPGGTDAFFATATAAANKAARGMVAPATIVAAVRAAVEAPTFEAGLRREGELFKSLAEGEQAPALQHVFFSERTMAKVGGLPKDVRPQPLKSVAIVGAGTMGGGIAMCFANSGVPVTIIDRSEDALVKGVSIIRGNYERTRDKGKLSAELCEQRMALISTTTSYDVQAKWLMPTGDD